jgi:hypothetical protein
MLTRQNSVCYLGARLSGRRTGCIHIQSRVWQVLEILELS